jgi:hypothetical protein
LEKIYMTALLGCVDVPFSPHPTLPSDASQTQGRPAWTGKFVWITKVADLIGTRIRKAQARPLIGGTGTA